jgi:hypothetical protein
VPFRGCAAFRDLLKTRLTESHLQVTAYLSCISTGLSISAEWGNRLAAPGSNAAAGGNAAGLRAAIFLLQLARRPLRGALVHTQNEKSGMNVILLISGRSCSRAAAAKGVLHACQLQDGTLLLHLVLLGLC